MSIITSTRTTVGILARTDGKRIYVRIPGLTDLIMFYMDHTEGEYTHLYGMEVMVITRDIDNTSTITTA